jgi:hypothetical protein
VLGSYPGKDFRIFFIAPFRHILGLGYDRFVPDPSDSSFINCPTVRVSVVGILKASWSEPHTRTRGWQMALLPHLHVTEACLWLYQRIAIFDRFMWISYHVAVHLELELFSIIVYGTDKVKFQQGKEISLFSTVSRPGLGPAQPPIQWLPGLKQPEHDADLSPPSNTVLKSIPSYVFKLCLINQAQGQLYFTDKVRLLTGIPTILTEGFVVLLRLCRKVEY